MNNTQLKHYSIIFDGNGRQAVGRMYFIGTKPQAVRAANKYAEYRHLAFLRTYIFERDILAGINTQIETREFSKKMGY